MAKKLPDCCGRFYHGFMLVGFNGKAIFRKEFVGFDVGGDIILNLLSRNDP